MFAGTLGGLFSQILSGEDLVRERAIKFLNSRLKLGSSDPLPKEVEEFIIEKTKEVGSSLFSVALGTDNLTM